MGHTRAKKISVIIVSFNTGPLLDRALSSLLEQEGLYEVVVVNNGNPGDVEKRLAQMARDEKRICLVSGQGNIGFAAGCNRGVERASGDLIVLMNPDGMLSHGGLGRLASLGAGLDRPWMLGCRLVDSDGSEQRGGRRELLTPVNALVEALGLYRVFPATFRKWRLNHHQRPLPEQIVEIPAISGAFMMMPLDDYRSVGGMDEGYFLHVEDLDFCLRFRQQGGEIYFCPDVSLTHHQGSSDASSVFVEWHKFRGFCYYFRRHFSRKAFFGLIPLVKLAAFGRFLVIAGRGVLRSRSG